MSSEDPVTILLGDERRIAAASDYELLNAISKCLDSGGGHAKVLIPPLHLFSVFQLVQRLVYGKSVGGGSPPEANAAAVAAAASPPKNNTTTVAPTTETPSNFFCEQQLKLAIANFLVTAAKIEGHMIQSWFNPPTPRQTAHHQDAFLGSSMNQQQQQQQQQQDAAAVGGGVNENDDDLDSEVTLPQRRSNASSRKLDDTNPMSSSFHISGNSPANVSPPLPSASSAGATPTLHVGGATGSSPSLSLSLSSASVPTLVIILLEALNDEAHSLVAGEILRLFLQHSPAFLQAFVAYRVPSPSTSASSQQGSSNSNSTKVAATGAQQQHVPFRRTVFGGVLAPLLTDTCALRNHAAWQVLFAALQSDTETLRPSREVVELLSRSLHAFLEVIVNCLRHANPASRRFAFRLVSDIIQLFSDWMPISHCILQSPAIYFALLANSEGGPVATTPEHWPVYHILKMFVMFPKKCPLMRHLCFMNRDQLAMYVQSCAGKFQVPARETELILSKLAAMTPLTAEEAALVHCAI